MTAWLAWLGRATHPVVPYLLVVGSCAWFIAYVATRARTASRVLRMRIDRRRAVRAYTNARRADRARIAGQHAAHRITARQARRQLEHSRRHHQATLAARLEATAR